MGIFKDNRKALMHSAHIIDKITRNEKFPTHINKEIMINNNIQLSDYARYVIIYNNNNVNKIDDESMKMKQKKLKQYKI